MARSDQHALATFNTLAEIRFPEEVLTKGEENVLVHDTGSDDESRVLVFSNNSLLEILNEATILQMDGTFRICPNLFHQLYTIHCWFRGRCVPVIYALLPSATSETYGKRSWQPRMHSQLNSPMQTSSIVFTIFARVIGEKFKSLGTLLNMETIPISRDRSENFLPSPSYRSIILEEHLIFYMKT